MTLTRPSLRRLTAWSEAKAQLQAKVAELEKLSITNVAIYHGPVRTGFAESVADVAATLAYLGTRIEEESDARHRAERERDTARAELAQARGEASVLRRRSDPTDFIARTNKDCRAWMESMFIPSAIEQNFLLCLWAWQEQEKRLNPQPKDRT